MMKKIMLGVLIIILISFLVFNLLDKKDEKADILDIDTNVEEKKEIVEGTDKPIEERDFLRTDSKGPVEVSVAFNNIIEANDKELVFEIYLNTHSVDLENIEFENLSIFRTNNGVEIDNGFSWEVSGGSGHHISGLLKVSNNINGNKILDENTEYIELELIDIGGVESKKFKWDSETLKDIDNINRLNFISLILILIAILIPK